jgi:hypothetical protein
VLTKLFRSAWCSIFLARNRNTIFTENA